METSSSGRSAKRPKANRRRPFILVVEGSIPNENNKTEGYWASFGTDAVTGQPITTCEWIDRLAPKAWAIIAAGTCATYGGHSCHGGKSRRAAWACPTTWDGNGNRAAEIPIVCVPGCPVQPDNMMETILYLLYMASGRAPMIPLDDALRPTWLFGSTLHEGCDRGGYYEQGEFAEEYGSPLCIVKLGCWGPVVQCNVGKRGWMGGIGGCPNVGGICIGCTMPGFPDKFMPFMNQPPGSLLSSQAVQTYGRAIHALRRFTQASLNKEPNWRSQPQNAPTRELWMKFGSVFAMSTFWKMDADSECERDRVSSSQRRTALSPEAAEAILTGLAGTYLKTTILPDHSALFIIFSKGSIENPISDAQLPNLEAKYRALVEQLPAVVFMAYLDRGIGEAYVSPQIEATLGFSQSEWLEDPVLWYRQVHPDDKDRWSMEASEMFLSGKPLRSAYRVIARDGRWSGFTAKPR